MLTNRGELPWLYCIRRERKNHKKLRERRFLQRDPGEASRVRGSLVRSMKDGVCTHCYAMFLTPVAEPLFLFFVYCFVFVSTSALSRMLDHVSVFSKSGLVLWSRTMAKLKGNPMDDLVKNVLLEARGGTNFASTEWYTLR